MFWIRTHSNDVVNLALAHELEVCEMPVENYPVNRFGIVGYFPNGQKVIGAYKTVKSAVEHLDGLLTMARHDFPIVVPHERTDQ